MKGAAHPYGRMQYGDVVLTVGVPAESQLIELEAMMKRDDGLIATQNIDFLRGNALRFIAVRSIEIRSQSDL